MQKACSLKLKAVLEKPFSQLFNFGKVKGARFVHDCSVSSKSFLQGSRRSENFEFDLFDSETVSNTFFYKDLFYKIVEAEI